MSTLSESDPKFRELLEKHAELHAKKLEVKAEMAQVRAEALKHGASLQAAAEMRCW
jgi:uncharacterized protein YdcH (DUF465 family)